MLHHVEACYDAIPVAAGAAAVRVEEHGPLRLFIREGTGWPYYARPAAPGVVVSAQDVLAVRARMRELGIPEAFEWVAELVPTLDGAAREAGLQVRLCPLLVLDGDPVTDAVPPGVRTDLLGGEDAAAIAAALAVAQLAFGHSGHAAAGAGPAERDALAARVDETHRQELTRAISCGRFEQAVACLDTEGTLPGVLATGGLQHAQGVAELVGIATLPVARQRGLAVAITVALAARARERGLGTVFLSAADDAAARIYQRAGFRRRGTAGLAEPA